MEKRNKIKSRNKKNEIIDNLYRSFITQKLNCGTKWFVDLDILYISKIILYKIKI